MQTFRYLVVLGVGTVLTLSSINRGIAQPQDPIPQQQADSYRHTDPLLSDSGSNSTHRRGGSSTINLTQNSAPGAQLPPVDPASPPPTPSPTPLPATPTPSPTPPTPSPSPTIPSQEELNRLNPSPDLLETPTDPDAVRLPATPQPITLQQALELARRNNRDLQVAEVTLRRDRAALREAQAALLPTVSAQADLTRQSPGASGNLSETSQFGGTIVQNRTSTGLAGTVQASYDVFTSGRRPATIQRQEEQIRFSELEVERLTEQLRLDVSNDYYDVQEADAQVRINQAAVDNSRASLRDAQALERAGLGTRFDVLQAQVQLANDIQQLTDSFSQQRITRRQLVESLSLGSSVDVSAADPIAVAPRWTLSLEESTVLAFQNRAELGQQLAQRNISEQNRRIALADLGPQVSFVVGYNPQYVFQDNSGNVFNQAFTGFVDNFSIGPRVTLNIFDGGAARARAAQEEANIRIAETNFANTRNQVRFAVEQAFFSLDSSFANIATASTAVDQARESLRLARLRFQAGVGIQSDVLDAVAALAQAEGNRVTAILGYNRALVSLQREISNLQVTAP